jgi:hypothetical protein
MSRPALAGLDIGDEVHALFRCRRLWSSLSLEVRC